MGWDTGNYDEPLRTWDSSGPAPITLMPETKVTYSVESVLGFISSTRSLLNTHKTPMTAAGVDPTALLASLETLHNDLTTKNAAQENLKTQLRLKTTEVEGARDLAYSAASQGVDKVISAFGRTSEQAKEAVNLRKSLRPAAKAKTPPPNP